MFAEKENIDNPKAKTAAGQDASFFQPKLAINQPNDIYEQEANHMADKVMRMADTSLNQNTFFKPAPGTLQRKCQACEEEDQFVHRKEGNGSNIQSGDQLDHYVSSLGSTERASMPKKASRKFFEPKFGHDFSNVPAAYRCGGYQSRHQSITTLAYTTGNNVVFDSGQFSPESDGGKKLMAHELTHVVQQQGNLKSIQKAPLTNTQAPPSTEVNQKSTETISNARLHNMLHGTIRFPGTQNSRWCTTCKLAKRVTIVSRFYSTASDSVKAAWKNAIESRWGKGQFNMEVWDGCEPKVFPIDVDIQWVTDPAKAHYTIKAGTPGGTQGSTYGVGGTNSMTDWGYRECSGRAPRIWPHAWQLRRIFYHQWCGLYLGWDQKRVQGPTRRHYE